MDDATQEPQYLQGARHLFLLHRNMSGFTVPASSLLACAMTTLDILVSL